MDRYILIAACGLALFLWFLYRGWRAVPVFGLYLAAQVLMLEPLAVLCRGLATIEAYWIHCGGNGRRRAGLGLAAVTVCILAPVWVLRPDTPLASLAQIGYAVFLLAY